MSTRKKPVKKLHQKPAATDRAKRLELLRKGKVAAEELTTAVSRVYGIMRLAPIDESPDGPAVRIKMVRGHLPHIAEKYREFCEVMAVVTGADTQPG